MVEIRGGIIPPLRKENCTMACKTSCQLCKRLVISQAVTFADGVLTINIPAGTYNNGEKYCIVIAQTIPQTATITAPVVITIGAGTEQYPLTDCKCAQVTACALRTRRRYSTVVSTSATGGTFRLIGKASCCPDYSLPGINGTAPAAGGETG